MARESKTQAVPSPWIDEPAWFYRTDLGAAYCCDAAEALTLLADNSIQLILTSPPFPLLRQKEYGNESQDKYVDWLLSFAPELHRVLKDDGSLVIELGSAWVRKRPVRSTYQFEVLLRLVEAGFSFAQDFYWYNPARLPAPAQWITVKRIRVKDSVSPIWWLGKTDFPKADNRKVLKPYSESQLRLFKYGYNQGRRPSGHVIGDGFSKRNSGAIRPNFLEVALEMSPDDQPPPDNVIRAANTRSVDSYQEYCRAKGLALHPARFPVAIPEFFVRFLTDEGDYVLDPFAGSNVTGWVAQANRRRWLAFEKNEDYVASSVGRFLECPNLEVNHE